MRNEMELKHHGVKGQQWGVQHGPPYPIDRTKNRTRVRKGTTLNRLTVHDERQSKGHAYVTYRKSDSRHYSGFFAARLRTKNPLSAVYQLKMSALEDLISPSKQERMDTFKELYKSDKHLRKELGDYYKSDSKNWMAILPKQFYEYKFSHLSQKQIENIGYSTFVRSVGGNEYIRSKYFKALQSKGFNYVIDDMDAGRFGNEPSIIFDREKSTKYESRRAVDAKESVSVLRKEGIYLKQEKNKKNKKYR